MDLGFLKDNGIRFQLILSIAGLGLMFLEAITTGECVIIVILAGAYGRLIRNSERIQRLGNTEDKTQ